MKKALILFFAILAIAMPLCVAAQNRVLVRSCDRIGSVRENNYATMLPPKSERSSNQAGKIELIFEEEIPEQVKATVNMAKDTWESKLKNEYPIAISISYQEYFEDIAIVTDVLFYVEENGSYSRCSALDAQINKQTIIGDEEYHAFISISPNVKWDFSYDGASATGEKNLYSAMLRAFASCFGFGASVTLNYAETPPTICFNQLNIPSDFDNLVINGNDLVLSDITDPTQLKNYCEGKLGSPVYVLSKDSQHKLYVPDEFVDCVSMRYLDNPNSLMHYDVSVDDKRLAIDNVTVEVLNALGWNIFSTDAVKIVCDDIADDGIGSAYKSHNFSLDGCDGVSVENPEWKFEVLDADGSVLATQTSSDLSFTVAPLNNPESYPINGNGDIRGDITFHGKIDGEECSKRFTVFLELKPRIISVSEPRFVYHDNSFDVYFSVSYVGSEYITASAEEDYSSVVRRFRFDQPYYGNLSIKNISYYFYSWIDLTVQNKYGTATHSLEIEPQYPATRAAALGQERITVNQGADDVEVYDLNGIKLNVSNIGAADALPKGIYIIKSTSASGEVATRKLMVK